MALRQLYPARTGARSVRPYVRNLVLTPRPQNFGGGPLFTSIRTAPVHSNFSFSLLSIPCIAPRLARPLSLLLFFSLSDPVVEPSTCRHAPVAPSCTRRGECREGISAEEPKALAPLQANSRCRGMRGGRCLCIRSISGSPSLRKKLFHSNLKGLHGHRRQVAIPIDLT